MILAELLSRTGEIISKNWYYSTELRVLNTQIIMSTLFRFISDWRIVRTVGTVIHLVILESAFLFLCRSTRIGEKLIYLSPLILWPFSDPYCDFVLYGLYYIPHLSIIFLTLGLCLDSDQTRKPFCLFVLICLSFAAGLGGIRMLVICDIPLFIASAASFFPFMRSERGTTSRFFLFSAAASAACLIGFLINHNILLKVYRFWNVSDLRLTGPDVNKIITVVKDTFLVLGAAGYKNMLSSTLIILMGGFFMIMGFRLFKDRHVLTQEVQILLAYFLLSYFATAAGPVLMTQSMSPRYMIMPCIGFTVLLAAYADQYPLSSLSARAMYTYILVILTVSGLIQFRIFVTQNRLEKETAAFRFILDSDMEFGFGHWDASDALTELSNGRIHMCKINNTDNPYIWYWLMEKDFKKYADGKPVFLILANEKIPSEETAENALPKSQKTNFEYLTAGRVIFSDDNYTVWLYESLEAFESALGFTV